LFFHYAFNSLCKHYIVSYFLMVVMIYIYTFIFLMFLSLDVIT
jgi:hypothetical protein